MLCSVWSIDLCSHINYSGQISVSFIPISEASTLFLYHQKITVEVYPSSAAGCGQEVWSVVVYMSLPVMSASNNSCMTSLPLSFVVWLINQPWNVCSVGVWLALAALSTVRVLWLHK